MSTLIDNETVPQTPINPGERWPIGLTVGDRYFIEKELGHGGIGAVFLARDRKVHDRAVVVKVLLEKSLGDERILQKFRQEQEALARVDHPGIIGILDTGELPDGNPYLVMQYVAGTTLRNALSAQGIDLERAARIIKQLGSALSAAHDKGILHRDLKPENIMLQSVPPDEELVRVIDFGVAKVKDSLVAPSTATPNTLGTYGYMSPEQFRGARVTAASDIFSLGVIAYEMVTGRRPFNPESVGQLNELHQHGVRIKPIDLRPALSRSAQEIILKALSFEPARRYQTAREFGDSLSQALIRGEEPVQKSSSLARTSMQRRTAIIAVITIAVAASLVVVWAAFFRERVAGIQPQGVVRVKPLTNSLKMEFLPIPAGTFLMGSINFDPDEQPTQIVTIKNQFYLGRSEVTQGQWQAVMGTNPSHFRGVDRPVENVSWEEIQDFIRKLNTSSTGYTYRLPSESEWEYACRAGTPDDFAGDLDLMAWYANNSGQRPFDGDEIWRTDRDNYAQRVRDNGNETHPVGQKQPNGFGLYDMHGNAWEWSADYYHPNYTGAPTDGSAWLSGGDMNYRVMRGGSRASIRGRCRCTVRKLSAPNGRGDDVGFRLVAVPGESR